MPIVKLKMPSELRGYPDRVRGLMKELGVTQGKLEELTGISQGKISKLINGQDELGGSVAYAVLIAQALSVRVGFLLVGEEPKARSSAPVSLPQVEHATPEHSPNVSVRTKNKKH